MSALRIRMDGTPPDKQERVLDTAVILEVDADDAGRLHHDLASALLEGTVVPAGWGRTAVSHLQAHMHTQAGLAYEGDVEAWVNHLADLRVPVYADRSGPAAATARARQIAVDNYRKALQTVAGHVDLSLLAEDLEPLVIDDLADNLEAVIPQTGRSRNHSETRLLVLARRIPRLLLEGLPGSGKSAATTQLAARWAADLAAPLPVLVRLREVGERCSSSSDVSLELLCELAAARAPEGERVDLGAALCSSVERGEAVLLLDGLDECLDRQALVAQGLKAVLHALPVETGVLITTRPSGSIPAARLSLQRARLSTPRNLAAVLERLLRHIAATRVPAADRDAWVAERSHRVHTIREEHRDLGSVPLLAVLITLVLADDHHAMLPATTAGVLQAAVAQTIERWERRRPRLPQGYSVHPTEKQLLVGFAAIGNLLGQRTTPFAAEVLETVAAAMTDRWRLAPEPAAETARAIQWFWDDQVGVFVTDKTGTVVARSRVFVEIGTAMWCPSTSDDRLRQWVSSAVGDPDKHTALLLAAEVDRRVVTELLTPSVDTGQRYRLAATALRNGATFDARQIEYLLTQLVDMAHRSANTSSGTRNDRQDDGTQAKNDKLHRNAGPVWPWALETARLPLPAPLDPLRIDLLSALPLSDGHHVIARGITALASADAATRALTSAEQGHVLHMLSVPLPPPPPKVEPVRQVSRRRFVSLDSVGMIEGLGQAVARAAARLPELAPHAVDLIRTVAKRVSYRDALDISEAMRRHGHRLDVGLLPPETQTEMNKFGDQFYQGYRTLLTTVASLSHDDVKLTTYQQWRLLHLCELFNALEAVQQGMAEFWPAVQVDTEQTRAIWLRSMSLAANLDLTLLASEARFALARFDENHLHLILELLFITPEENDRNLELHRLDSDDIEKLWTLLTATSDWISHSAVQLLWNASIPGMADRIDTFLPTLPAYRRFHLAILRCKVSTEPDDHLRKFFDSNDPALRRAAAAVFRINSSDPELVDLKARALLDDDATIRVAAGATALEGQGVPLPKYWSCLHCAQINNPEDIDCQSCEEGTHPKANENDAITLDL